MTEVTMGVRGFPVTVSRGRGMESRRFYCTRKVHATPCSKSDNCDTLVNMSGAVLTVCYSYT